MSLRARYLLLTVLRWLPTGLLVPVVALLPLDRGLTVAQYGAAAATQGVVVLCLELPTGGLTDALGRRPVLIASAVVSLVAYAVMASADSMALFVLAYALMGVYRALDSGPLNAWFVDAVHDASPAGAQRERQVASGLSASGTVIGASIALGAVTSGAAVALGAPLSAPLWAGAALIALQLGAVAVLMQEPRAGRRGLAASLRATPRTVLEGVVLLRRSRVLAALVAVELFWGFGMFAFESLTPVRLAELLGDRDDAAAVMGPVSAAAWGVSALGAAIVPLLLRRWSPVQVSVAMRLVQGATVVAMGLAWGPLGLVLGYLATYAVHSVSGVVYESLLHREVENRHRATVLSLASMAMQPAASLSAVVLGALATGAGTPVAIVVAGVVLALAAPLFLVRPRAAVGDAPATTSGGA